MEVGSWQHRALWPACPPQEGGAGGGSALVTKRRGEDSARPSAALFPHPSSGLLSPNWGGLPVKTS